MTVKEEQIKQLNALINLYKEQPENLEVKIWTWHSKIIDDKMKEKYINLIIVMLFYFIPALFFKYIIGNDYAASMWLFSGWLLSIGMLVYLDNKS